MAYKLVAVDLDDTLLGDDLAISPKTIDAIQQCIKKGVTVTLATGRMYQSAVQFAKEIKLNVPIITYQGAYVKDSVGEQVLYQRKLSEDTSVRIIKELKKRGKQIQIYLNDELYAEENNTYVAKYGRITRVGYYLTTDLIKTIIESKTTPLKILAVDEPLEIKILLEEMSELFRDEAQINISKPHFLEFSHIEATKGQAIRFLAKQMNISLDEVIAIGDSYNDLDMIEVAGLGVAMGNADSEIKAKAKYVTKSNNDEGVLEVLQKFILEKSSN